MAEIKAIETIYNGYRFRSRLEARWAVFFDNAFIAYEYEPEGFVLPNGEYYLPDFYLPLFHMYVEIKPYSISDDDYKTAKGKLEQLFFGDQFKEHGKGITVAIFNGEPIENYTWAFCKHKNGNGETGYGWHPIKFVRGVKGEYKGKKYMFRKPETIVCVYGTSEDCFYDTNASDGNARMINVHEIKSADTYFRNAKIRARQARFEYGERG